LPEGAKALPSKGCPEKKMDEVIAKHGHHGTAAVMKTLKINGRNLLASVRTTWVVVRHFFSVMRFPFIPVWMMKSIMQMMTLGT